MDMGCLITERARNTGNPAVSFEHGESVDAGTQKKRNAQQEFNGLANKIVLEKGKRFPFDFEELVKSAEKSWMAIIHADGNGLGKVLQQVGNQLKDRNEMELIQTFQEFSKKLEESTINATKSATSVFVDYAEKGKGKSEFYPFRPIILGGDDLTVVIRSEFALSFTQCFLEEFEKETAKNLTPLFNKYNIKIDCLTACAGIAFIKSSFPFHYGYDLAEQLCSIAKKESKKINNEKVPASLMFHKIQSSFIGTFDEIIKQELTCYDGLSYVAGPYFLKKYGITIKDLDDNAKELMKEGAPASQLRRWVTERYSNDLKAKSLMARTIQVLEMDNQRKRFISNLNLKPELFLDDKAACPYYDYISMASLLKN